jgi:hypothetical protein
LLKSTLVVFGKGRVAAAGLWKAEEAEPARPTRVPNVAGRHGPSEQGGIVAGDDVADALVAGDVVVGRKAWLRSDGEASILD